MRKDAATGPRAAPPPSRREQAAVGWSGLAFVVAGLAGWHFLPQVALVWLLLLVLGIATVPQVAIWRWRERR